MEEFMWPTGENSFVQDAYDNLVRKLSSTYRKYTGADINEFLSGHGEWAANESMRKLRKRRTGEMNVSRTTEISRLECESAAFELGKLRGQLEAKQWRLTGLAAVDFAEVAMAVGRAIAHDDVEQTIAIGSKLSERKATSGAQKGARERALKAFVEVSLKSRIKAGFRCKNMNELIGEVLEASADFYNHEIFKDKRSASLVNVEKIINDHFEKDESFGKSINLCLKMASTR